ncbi:MAG: ribonuclease G [Burkholderiales bacterium]|nr:ribonuclease G [Burkholderiales bacterium]
MENSSGQGKQAVVPPELKGWNFGAMLLNWIWGLGNGTYIALLMFVPFVNFVMFFVLGAKGNEWAWRNKKWDSVEHFQKVQKTWTTVSLVLLALGVVGGIAGAMMAPSVPQ